MDASFGGNAYDALHRLVSKTYPSGSYASVTPSKFFVYDSATVNGVAMVNAKGRLAEAYTCTGSCTSKITDEGFSYTARGELSDQYQSSPNSGGYYHANYLYWANGAMQQISGLPSLPTFNYGVDPEGRINTLSASTGQIPLTGTTYSSASLPTGLTFGSGDSDAYSFTMPMASACAKRWEASAPISFGMYPTMSWQNGVLPVPVGA
jgi:hypothetical protein